MPEEAHETTNRIFRTALTLTPPHFPIDASVPWARPLGPPAPVALRLESSTIPRYSTFSIRVVCDARWMREQGVGVEAIRAACAGAVVRLEGQEQNLPPCTRCSKRRPKRLVTIGHPVRVESRAESDGRERVFVFSQCKSNCNSSRLHLGGRVVIVVAIRGPQGLIAEALSEPLVLVSRSAYIQKPRGQMQFRWVDQITSIGPEAGCSASAEKRVAEKPKLASDAELRGQLQSIIRLQGGLLDYIRALRGVVSML
eukprot:m51a1_g7659 hypothetical protein (255) ;mRNA; f:413210-416926